MERVSHNRPRFRKANENYLQLIKTGTFEAKRFYLEFFKNYTEEFMKIGVEYRELFRNISIKFRDLDGNPFVQKTYFGEPLETIYAVGELHPPQFKNCFTFLAQYSGSGKI